MNHSSFMFNTYLTGIRFIPAFFGEDTGVCIQWQLQPSQLLFRIIHLSNTRISVSPEVEEFLVMLYGFAFPAFLPVNLSQHVEALSIYQKKQISYILIRLTHF